MVLEYLYTDHLDIDINAAMDLFAAADLFDIPRLQTSGHTQRQQPGAETSEEGA